MEQLSLHFEPGLAQRFRDLRECMAACVYNRGLGRVAAAVDVAPSNLSAMLSGDRHLPTDIVEGYMREFGDTTPALFLAARYCRDARAVRDEAIAQIPGVIAQLSALLDAAKETRA